ncbi:hypothetical protein DPMN_144936 [Dreissena polymorpha]|uniref:Uncharacterized protein n=1 Tax=Dreissena polymorpha TaxID=45954 RepID=A0A9D4IYC3_DREPO|nr:hypothetical protein DPMN_144936 [Dreissena polymorpha]
MPDEPLKQGMSVAYRINTTRDGRPVNHDPVTITVGPVDANGQVILQATGPYFNDPGVTANSTAGQPFMGLWDYEGISTKCYI